MEWDFLKQKMKEISSTFFPKGRIKIIATSTVDSVVASSFLIKAFQHLNYNFSATFYKKITDASISELANDPSDILLFINPHVKKINVKKEILVIESHSEDISDGIKIISPKQLGQKKDFPASVLAYLLCKELYQNISEFSYLLPIPYLEDNSEIPEEITREAIIAKKLEISKGITLLISQTMSVHKSIANTLCPYLPGISGSEDNSVQLLIENNIPLRENNKFRRLIDLNEDETKRLLTAILLKRLGSEKNPSLVLNQTYLMPSEDDNSFIKDLKGFLFLIESCIAYSRYSLAVSIALNPSSKSKAIEFVNNAQANLVSSMEYYLLNKKSLTTESDKIAILNLSTNLDHKLLNLFAKIVSQSNFLNQEIIAIIVTTPLNEVLCNINNPEIIPKLQVLMKVDSDNLTIKIKESDEEELIKNLLTASQQ